MLSAVRWKCRSSPWVGPRATLGKRASWRKSLLVESLLYEQVLRYSFYWQPIAYIYISILFVFMFWRIRRFI